LQSLEFREPLLHLRIGGVHFVRFRHVGISGIPVTQAQESDRTQHAARNSVLRCDCLRPVCGVICPTRLRCAYFREVIVIGRNIGSRRFGRDKRKPMLLCALIILALEAQSPAKIFDPCGRLLECFLPFIERALQAIEFLAFELHLRERVPSVGIVRSDGDNAPAQFNDCGLVLRVLSFLQLIAQLLKLWRFPGGESAASEHNKNSDRERPQVARDLDVRDPNVQALSTQGVTAFQSFPPRQL
jgi:hypothetical protein